MGHYFYKFVPVPEGSHGCSKRAMQAWSWDQIGSPMRASDSEVMSEVEHRLEEYWNDESPDTNHVDTTLAFTRME